MKYYEIKEVGVEEKHNEDEVESENEQCEVKKEESCSDVTMKEEDKDNRFFDTMFIALVEELKEDLETSMLERHDDGYEREDE